MNRYISIFFLYSIWSGPSLPRPGVLCVQTLYKKRHTHLHNNDPQPRSGGARARTGRQAGSGGWVRGAGPRLGRVHSRVSPRPQRPSCYVLLFVMLEQLCVNISKSLKNPETQPYPVLVISPPRGSQAAVVQEASALFLWGQPEPGKGLPLPRKGKCLPLLSRQGGVGARAPGMEWRLLRPGPCLCLPRRLPVSFLVARRSPGGGGMACMVFPGCN